MRILLRNRAAYRRQGADHTAGTIRGVAATYNRFEYLDERKAALETWGRFVEGLVRPVPSNVVPLVAAG